MDDDDFDLGSPAPAAESVAPGPRADVDFVLGPDGPFAQKVKGYETRPGQLAYARSVEACIDAESNPERTPLFIEGPTGTGKTLGYLIPAIGSVLNRRFRAGMAPNDPEPWKWRRRVLVVTGNIALQEQLIQKDLPTIKDTTGWNFTYALLKGRSNYGCHRAADDLKTENQKGLFPDDMESEVLRLRKWFEQSKSGDKSEIDPAPAGVAWSTITSTSDECSGKKCPFYDQCHYYGQRRTAWKSDVIVTNYALLLTEIALRMEMGAPSILLPEFDIVICDEAHDLGDIARRYFAKEIKASQLRQMGRLLNGPRLGMKAEGDKAFALARTWNEMAQQRIDSANGSVLYEPDRFGEQRKQVVATLKEISDAVSRKVSEFRRMQGISGVSDSDIGDSHKKAIDAIQRPGKMAESYIELMDAVFPKPDEPVEPADPAVTIPAAVKPVERMVYYIDGGYGEEGSQKNYSFVACPFSAGDRLKEALWDNCEIVILTSATLATRTKAGEGSRFGFVRSDLGLLDVKCFEDIVDSPFDFEKNMGVYIDAELDPTSQGNTSEVARRITALIKASRGRALVLFTSYRAMKEVHAIVSRSVQYRCYLQGESSRSTLTNKFRNEVSSCLFATRSFFQGIDIQGESLSMLILDKIPFPMMNDPFIETAKREGERSGKKWGWFDKHSVPRALMAFRQAIGRLIRTQTDRGVVAILDSRIAVGGKGYGKMFRDAIPSSQYLSIDGVGKFFGTESEAPVEPDMDTDGAPAKNPSVWDDDIPF